MYRYIFSTIVATLIVSVLASSCSRQEEDSKISSKKDVRVIPAAALPGNDMAKKGSGSIHGRVIFEGNVPAPQKLMVVKDTEICGLEDQFDERLIISQNKGILNSVVYLSGVAGGKPLSTLGNEFVLDQTGCRYQPHLLIIPVNTPLQILNDDNILHNFHTFSKKNRPLNLAQPKSQKKMEVTFRRPEIIPVRCDLHGWMSGWIVVVDHPYYTITDVDGNFSLSDIPPGTYTLHCWQEMLGDQTAQVDIEPGKTTSLNFTYNQASQ